MNQIYETCKKHFFGRENLIVIYFKIKDGAYSAWGESSPGKTEGAESPEIMQNQLEDFISQGIKDNSIYELYEKSREMGIAPCAYASLDMALWGFNFKKSKYATVPLFRLT